MSKLLPLVLLTESVSHIEDLPVMEFIRAVQSIKEKVITEKLDGDEIVFGIDDIGLFTTLDIRAGKKNRFYDINDYNQTAGYNGYRAAHIAITKIEPQIRKHLVVGDLVKAEILFSQQPNAVKYSSGKNFIVIQQGINATPEEHVTSLIKAIDDKKVTIHSDIVSSPDGNKLESKKESMTWRFVNVAPIATDKVDISEADDLLDKLSNFIVQKNKVLPDLTNLEVAEVNLGQIPKDNREAAKAEREKINAYIMNTYKAPIKEILLDKLVRNLKPFLQKSKKKNELGVEGVTINDPISGSQITIRDRDVFLAINSFNSSVEANISGLVRTTDQQATIDMRGGAFGQAKIRIAELLGAKELALSSGTRRFITKFKKDTPEATLEAVAQSLNINNLESLKTKISAILVNAVDEVNGILHNFNQESGEFKLKLKTGKEIGITPEVMKHTLTAFAETKKDIAEINAGILKSNSVAELLMALYGKTIESIFSGEKSEMNESLNLIKSVNKDKVNSVAIKPTTDAQDQTPKLQIADNRVVSKHKRNFIKPKKFPRPTLAAIKADDANKKPTDLKVKEEVAAGGGTTAAGSIAAFPQRLGPSLGPKAAKAALSTKINEPTPKKKKYSFLNSIISRDVKEDWAHVKDMKFATDVDDSARAQNDIEFNQLRNNVNMGDDITQMDVNKYLDKAHDLNDEVDTVTYGMEMSDGSIVKVYVNAEQAEEFETAVAQLLGQEDDIEEVIDTLANKFDIVDVEWPKQIAADIADGGEEPSPAAKQPEGEQPEAEPEAAPEGEQPEGENSDVNMDVETDSEPGSESSEEEPEEEESDEESAETKAKPGKGEERDEFGQIIKKSKKKKAEESKVVAGKMISEMNTLDEAAAVFRNPAIDAIAGLLAALGLDLNANKSFTVQAKALLNSPKFIAAKNSALTLELNKAGAILTKLIQSIPTTGPAAAANTVPANAPAATPGANPAPQFSGFKLIGDMVAEAYVANQGPWIIAKLGNMGLSLTTKGMRLKLDEENTKTLFDALKNKKKVSVKSTDGGEFLFSPISNGYSIIETTDSIKFPAGVLLTADQAQEILTMMAGK